MAPVVYTINILLEIYTWIIFARVILSWVRLDPYNPVVRLIYGLVDPVTRWISRYIPTRFGMFDAAPLILMLIVMLVQRFVVAALFETGIGV